MTLTHHAARVAAAVVLVLLLIVVLDAARVEVLALWSAVPDVDGGAVFRQGEAPALPLPLLVLCLFFATWLLEDLTCITAGLLVATGSIGFAPATFACLGGIFTGDLLLFLLGRRLGRPALARAPLRWVLTPAAVARAEAWFERRGAWVILLARALPTLRVPTYVTAGLLGMPLSRFGWVFLLAASLWTPLIVGAAWLVGDPVVSWLATWSRVGLLGMVMAAAVLLLGARVLAPLLTQRGRRLRHADLQRVVRWEFWPPWLFYLPVLGYVLFLGLRHRGLTVFTAANPGMPAGGFVGESKYDILRALAGAVEHRLAVAPVSGGTVEARAAFVQRFQQGHHLHWPLVLKPDVGERGRDVAIVRSQGEVRAYLEQHGGRTLVQEYAPGHEFGVFYYRYPHEAQGHILAITDKRPPVVTGDGHRRLETLILSDRRAVLMARHFLRVHAERLSEVPAAGEQVPLVELGTHCLGCLFLDGAWLETPALVAAIDRVSRGFEGFHFGRYDIRTPSVDDLRAGRNFRIVELNGVTSEATSIYDPANSLLRAWGMLMRQWRIAFEIGAANRRRGVRPASIMDLWRAVRAARGA